MVTTAKRFEGQRASVGWTRFGRDVLASILATGVATIAFSHLPREPRDGAPPAPPAKTQDRVTWQVEDVPVRMTRTFDSVAMFGLPQVEPSPWSTAPAAVQAEPAVTPRPNAALRIAAAGGEPPRRALAAMLPPNRPPSHRPADRAQDGPAHSAETSVIPSREEPARLLGWELPAGGLVPSGRDMLRKVASLGDAIAGAGEAIAEGVGLK